MAGVKRGGRISPGRFRRFARAGESCKAGGRALVRSLNTLGCAEFSLVETCALAAKHGLAGVEGGALGGIVDLAGDLAATEGAPGALAEKMGAEETGGRVVAFTPSMKLVGWAAAEREQAQAQEFFLDDARGGGNERGELEEERALGDDAADGAPQWVSSRPRSTGASVTNVLIRPVREQT